MIDSFSDERLIWLNNPIDWNVTDSAGHEEGSGGYFSVEDDGKVLKLSPPAFKDFWSRTFYSPLLIKHDASALLCTVPPDDECTLTVDFEFTPKCQFDQVMSLLSKRVQSYTFYPGWNTSIY